MLYTYMHSFKYPVYAYVTVEQSYYLLWSYQYRLLYEFKPLHCHIIFRSVGTHIILHVLWLNAWDLIRYFSVLITYLFQRSALHLLYHEYLMSPKPSTKLELKVVASNFKLQVRPYGLVIRGSGSRPRRCRNYFQKRLFDPGKKLYFSKKKNLKTFFIHVK